MNKQGREGMSYKKNVKEEMEEQRREISSVNNKQTSSHGFQCGRKFPNWHLRLMVAEMHVNKMEVLFALTLTCTHVLVHIRT